MRKRKVLALIRYVICNNLLNCLISLLSVYDNVLFQKKHCVLKSAHPSPLSAYRGFFGCKHFSKANEYLKKMKITTIDWSSLPVDAQ